MDCVGSLNAWAETQREDVWCDESCSATQAEAPLISSLSEKSEVLYYLQGYGGGLNALERDAREKLLLWEVFEDEEEFQVGRAVDAKISFVGKEFEVKANPYDEHTMHTRISTRHFRIESSSENQAGEESGRDRAVNSFRLVDNSSFGTWINGQKVDGYRMLQDEDEIGILMNRRNPKQVDLGFRFLLSEPVPHEQKKVELKDEMRLKLEKELKDEMILKLEKELQDVRKEVQSIKENPPKKKQKLTAALREVAKAPMFSFLTAKSAPQLQTGEALLSRELRALISATLQRMALEPKVFDACLEKLVANVIKGIHDKQPAAQTRQIAQWEAADVAAYIKKGQNRIEAYAYKYVGHVKERNCGAS